jgi:putative phage-type endonuclease
MIIHNVKQQSPEWFALRLRYPLTASNAQAIGNQGKGLETLCWEKMAEKYSITPKEIYTNKDLERGIELEEQGRQIYELESGNEVLKVGFITDKDVSPVGGASPDGLIGKDGNLEIKCLNDVKHFQMIAGKMEIESQYIWQVQMQMLFADRKWTDFVVFNPNYKKSILIQKIEVDPVMQEKIKVGLKLGEKIIKDIEKKIK